MKNFEHSIEKAVADGVVLGAVVCAKGTEQLADSSFTLEVLDTDLVK